MERKTEWEELKAMRDGSKEVTKQKGISHACECMYERMCVTCACVLVAGF